jgi:hypothetical protein
LADDICVIALTPRELQKVLDNIFQYSTRWWFTFNAAKSNVLHFHPRSCNPIVTFSWRLGKETIGSSNAYNHLGILLSSNFDPGTRTSNSCRKGRQAYFAMKTSEQLNPITVAKLYKKLFYLRLSMDAIFGAIFGQKTSNHWTLFNISSQNMLWDCPNIPDQTCAKTF